MALDEKVEKPHPGYVPKYHGYVFVYLMFTLLKNFISCKFSVLLCALTSVKYSNLFLAQLRTT